MALVLDDRTGLCVGYAPFLPAKPDFRWEKFCTGYKEAEKSHRKEIASRYEITDVLQDSIKSHGKADAFSGFLMQYWEDALKHPPLYFLHHI